jgi:hypothetical protein
LARFFRIFSEVVRREKDKKMDAENLIHNLASHIYGEAQKTFGSLCSKNQVQIAFDTHPFVGYRQSTVDAVRKELGLD